MSQRISEDQTLIRAPCSSCSSMFPSDTCHRFTWKKWHTHLCQNKPKQVISALASWLHPLCHTFHCLSTYLVRHICRPSWNTMYYGNKHQTFFNVNRQKTHLVPAIIITIVILSLSFSLSVCVCWDPPLPTLNQEPLKLNQILTRHEMTRYLLLSQTMSPK